MIPTLISIVDQLLASAWSHVGFSEFPNVMSDCSRMMDMTVTNVPTPNMSATDTFFFHAMRSCETCHSGTASIQRSSAMLMAAFAQPSAFTLMHLPVRCSPSHLTQ